MTINTKKKSGRRSFHFALSHLPAFNQRHVGEEQFACSQIGLVATWGNACPYPFIPSDECLIEFALLWRGVGNNQPSPSASLPLSVSLFLCRSLSLSSSVPLYPSLPLSLSSSVPLFLFLFLFSLSLSLSLSLSCPCISLSLSPMYLLLLPLHSVFCFQVCTHIQHIKHGKTEGQKKGCEWMNMY